VDQDVEVRVTATLDRPLRVGQRNQVDNYPVFAWSSPIWVTQGSDERDGKR
jgi:hypothetical protein